MTSGDSRSVRATKRDLKRALLDFMRIKPYQTVTVRELSERAEVCRTTFYTYYRDVPDLLEQIESEIIGEVAEECKKLEGKPYVEGEHPVVISMMGLLEKHRDAIRVITGQYGDICFVSRLQNVLCDISEKIWLAKFPNKTDREHYQLCSSFMTCGTIGMYIRKLEKGIDVTPEEMGYMAGEILVAVEDIVFR